MNSRRKCGGFTLVELIVVACLIVVMLALALPSLGSAREGGRVVKCRANLQTLALATMSSCDSHGGRIAVAECPWNAATRLVPEVVAQPFEAIRAELGEPAVWTGFAPARCPSDEQIGPAIGFGYWYVPANAFSFLSLMSPEVREERVRQVQSLYQDNLLLPIWKDINENAHAGRNPLGTRAQLALMDGSVGWAPFQGQPMDIDYWLGR